MKKVIILLLVVLTSGIAAIAQPQLFFGAGVGANRSRIKFSSSYSNEYIQTYRWVANNKKLLAFDELPQLGFQGDLKIGVKLGERFELLTAPAFLVKNTRFRTNDVVREPDKGDLEVFQDGSAFSLIDYTRAKGIRTWDISFNAIQVPLMVRLKLFGDRFGMNIMGGLAWNKYLKGGVYKTEFRENEGDLRAFSENPTWFPAIDPENPVGAYKITTPAKSLTNEYVLLPGNKLTFGSTQLDQFAGTNWSALLGSGFYFNLDEDGKVRLTLDFRFDFGLGDLYSKKRKDFLRTRYVWTVDPDDTTSASLEPLVISGTQKLRSGLLTIGVEMCPSCGF